MWEYLKYYHYSLVLSSEIPQGSKLFKVL